MTSIAGRIEELTPAAQQRLSRLAGFEVTAANVFSTDGKTSVEVIFQPEVSVVMGVRDGEVETVFADATIREFVANDVPVVLAFERATDAHRFGVMIEGGSRA